MKQKVLVAVIGLFALFGLGAKCAWPILVVAYDPYASVDWTSDVRCKTQLHDHVDASESRLRSYDDASYCAVSVLHYSGVPGQAGTWTQVHAPPQDWFSPAFLASLRSVRLLIPDAEQAGWQHVTSPFLSAYLECYYDATSRYNNPYCTRAPTPRQAHHYRNETELVNAIHERGGLAILAHPTWSTNFTAIDNLPVDMMEICSANAEYQDWKCKETGVCGSWTDAPNRMLTNYDRKLASRPRTWAVCVNDWHGPFANANPPGPAWIPDSGYQIVLLPQVDLLTLEARMRSGAMFAVQDRGVPKGGIPQVTRISKSNDAIVIEATDYASIDWIQGGVVVASGPFVAFRGVSPGALRAEIHGYDGSVVLTQPWELR